MKRDPSRAKASDIADVDMLSAIDDFSRIGAPWPLERFESHYPKKVVAAKLAKVRTRGWVDAKMHLTKSGREAFEKLIAESV